MNKLMLFLLMGMFLLSFGSALEFDNVRDYNPDTRTMKIDNAFGFGSTIAEITLNTPLNYDVAAGYQKVAEFTVDNKDQYNKALRTMKFYDKSDNLREFNRQFDYKVRSYENVIVDEYTTECNLLANKTQVCVYVLSGSHTERNEVWTNLNSLDLEEGISVIGVFTNVQVGDFIEWVPTFYGIEIDEWAVWTQSLNVGIAHYYKLDETSGVAIDSTNNKNLTNSGATQDVGGKIGTAYEFGGSDFLGNFSLTWEDNWTICMWANTTTTGFDNLLFSQGGATEARLRIDNVDKLQWSSINTLQLQSNGSVIDDGVYHYLCVYRNGTNERLYQDSILVDTGTTSITVGEQGVQFGGPASESWVGNIDEIGIWNRSLTQAEITQLFNGGTGITFINLSVILNSPVNDFNTSVSEVLFNATSISALGINLENISLYTNESGSFAAVNTTTSIGALTITETFNRTFADGHYLWSFESCNVNGVCSFAPENRTLTVDTIIPNITINAPKGLLSFNVIGGLETLNWSVADVNLDSCWFNYNGTNTTVTCGDNVTTFILEQDNLNLTFYANDTTGAENNSFVSWSYNVLENNQTFNVNTTEGSTESFSFNYSGNETPVSANFIYNGNVTSADIDATNFPIVILSESLVIPNVDSLTIVPFFWNIVTLSSNVNTTSTNQTISNLALDNCSTFTNTLFNLTVIDESSQIQLNGETDNVSVEVDITLFTSDKSSIVLNFSTAFNGTNPVAICSQASLFNGSNYILDATFRYFSLDRAIEFYNIRDSTVDNSSAAQNITLFDITTSESTDFQITFKNSNFIVVEDALIQVNRQYVSEGVFKTVELPITDSNGQAVVHLIQNDVVYNYIVTKDNEVIGTFNNLVAFCDDASIGQCFISLNAIEGTAEVFNPDGASGVSFTPLVFNTTSRDLSITFSTNDGTVKSVTMSATKMDQIGNTSVCSTTVVTSSGTITCNVPASFGNETIIVDVLVDGETSFISYFSAGNPFDIGIDGYFILLFLVISVSLMFTESKSMTIIGVIVGLIGGGLLFLTKGGFLATGASMIWIIIMGIILIWKLNLEGQT